MPNLAKLKGTKPDVKPVTFTRQANKVVLLIGEKWNFTVHEDEFKAMYDVVSEDQPKE